MGRYSLILIFLVICGFLFALLHLRRSRDREFLGRAIREQYERTLRTGHTGPMTAVQAVDAALMIATAEVRTVVPVLRGVYAESIDFRGYSFTWDVMFSLPCHSECFVYIEADPMVANPDEAPMLITARFDPVHLALCTEPQDEEISPSVLRREYECSQDEKPCFPFRMVNSPKALEIFMEQGLDPETATRDIAFSSVMLHDGTAVWQASMGDESWHTPMYREED